MNIQAVFIDYATDSASLPYASALAALLQAELVVGYAPPKGGGMTEKETETMRIRILKDVSSGISGDGAVCIRIARHGDVSWPKVGAIVVSNHLESHPSLPLWRPASEAAIRNTGAPILIPFGNKPEFEYGYLWGVALACRIDVPAIFYHTTWPRDGVVSACGRDHWHAGAEEVARCAEEYARERGVASEIVVERAANVREGVHQMALYRRALCIVAQQDRNVIAGGYHDELMRYGHLAPLVILPKGGK